jgi:hypothetical protein
MELTIPEQIKQCERIIENDSCNIVYPDCNSACNFWLVCPNDNANRKELAKAKLKQLRGENMDIINLSIENLFNLNEGSEIELNNKKYNVSNIEVYAGGIKFEAEEKEQEKEIGFVVGGVYESNKYSKLKLILLKMPPAVTIENKSYILQSIKGDFNYGYFKSKKEMKKFINDTSEKIKYTGRTLADIIKK